MEDTAERDLSKILRRVQQLISKAEGSNHAPEGTPEWEAVDREQKSAREMADALMLKYAIDEAAAEMAKPIHERMKPMSDLFEGGSGDLSRQIDELARMLASFTRTKIRYYAHYENGTHFHRVYGYESDVRYFTFLYTTLRLHLIGALRPELDPAKSMDENCYVLHNAGFGWREIAKMYGWTTKKDNWFDDTEVWYSPEGVRWEGETRIAVRPYRRAYFRECKKRGEEPIMNVQPEAFRLAAANGYMARLRVRIREVEESRKASGGSALALRVEDIEQFIREESGNCTRCPACGKLSLWDYRCDICGNTEGMPGTPPEPYEECKKCKAAKSGMCREHHIGGGRIRYVKHSEAGYQAGVRQANSADLGGQRTGSSSTKSIN